MSAPVLVAVLLALNLVFGKAVATRLLHYRWVDRTMRWIEGER